MIVSLLATLFTLPVVAQIEAGGYQAFKANGKTRGDFPEHIYVVNLFHGFSWFTNSKDSKPLEGTYHIVIHADKYYIGSFKKGFLHGDWEFYFHGRLTEKGSFDGGRPNGKYNYYHDNGQVESIATYKKREDHPSLLQHYIAYHENGKLKEEWHYDENGKRHGVETGYDEKGEICSKQEYVHGKLTGESLKKDKDGYTTLTGYENGYMVSETILYPNGNMKSQSFYEPKRPQTRTGKWVEKEENGDLKSEIEYLKNRKDGEEKLYYKNNKLRSLTEYKKDTRHGKEVVYEENPHTIRHEGTFKDGRRHGTYKTYHNGILWKETVYDEEKVVSEKQFENGKLQLLNLLDETGSLVNVEKYDNQGKKTYKNTNYKKHPSLKIKEDASGIIDIDVE